MKKYTVYMRTMLRSFYVRVETLVCPGSKPSPARLKLYETIGTIEGKSIPKAQGDAWRRILKLMPQDGEVGSYVILGHRCKSRFAIKVTHSTYKGNYKIIGYKKAKNWREVMDVVANILETAFKEQE